MKPSAFCTALMLGGLMLSGACSPQEDRMAGSSGAEADAGSEDRMIRMTGCVERGADASQYTLASVATAGVTGTTGDPHSITSEQEAQARAATSYRLLTMDDTDLSKYVGNRVTILGRLAADVPGAPSEAVPAPGAAAKPQASEPGKGQPNQSQPDPTGTTVTGQAPPLRGFWVERVQKVADTCEPLERRER